VRRGAIAIALGVLLLAGALTGCDSSSGSSAGGGSSATTRASATVVAQNLLHGLACAPDTDRCKLGSRVQLFARQLQEAGCPQVVSVEESDPVMDGFLKTAVHSATAGATQLCGGRYTIVGLGDPSSDREVILTTLPVLGHERVSLAGPLRDALWVRVKAAVGPLDVVATHLASTSDDRPCDASTCRPPCHTSDSLKTCQGREAAALLDDRRSPQSVGVLMGDLNAKPGDATINAITTQHFVDTFVAAGNPPCDAATGKNCTGGREDTNLSDLTNPSARQAERIDYVFLATKRQCTVDKTSGLFREAPESPPLDGLVFASDHTGVQAKITCVTTPADLAAARPVKASSTTTTTKVFAVDAATKAAVTKAFETVFDGGAGTSTESRLSSLQDADRLRASFIARYEDPSIKALADQVKVRIDSMQGVDARNVDVTYSILVSGAVALDHLPGGAVKVGNRWVVSRKSYCAVASLGATSVPEACR
jgi:endonuclease/exonuclease/phosphatase family metal-dependent hydrolase